MKATSRIAAVCGDFVDPGIAWLAMRAYRAPDELPDGFAEWFQGSQAVEPTTGAPRIFYHGSREPFTQFEPRTYAHEGGYKWRRSPSGRMDRCYFLTGDPALATCYGQWIMVAYLCVRRPLIVPTRDKFSDAVDDSDKLRQQGFDAIVFGNRYQSEYAIFDPSQAWIVANYPAVVSSAAAVAG